MLKLTIKPGEYINIGDDVRVIYSGGSEGNIHLLIDAPRELNIVRSKVLARNTANSDKKESRYISPYYAERGLSPETLSKIRIGQYRCREAEAAADHAAVAAVGDGCIPFWHYRPWIFW